MNSVARAFQLLKNRHMASLLLCLRRLEKGQQIPGVSAATLRIPSSIGDISNHSWCFPAEPTCRPDCYRQTTNWFELSQKTESICNPRSRTLSAFDKYLLHEQINEDMFLESLGFHCYPRPPLSCIWNAYLWCFFSLKWLPRNHFYYCSLM